MSLIICLFVINIGVVIFLTVFGDERNIPSRTEREYELIKKKNS